MRLLRMMFATVRLLVVCFGVLLAIYGLWIMGRAGSAAETDAAIDALEILRGWAGALKSAGREARQ